MDHRKKMSAIKNSSHFDQQEEMWCSNDMLESLKFIQLQNMFNMCFTNINNVLKVHCSLFNGSTKQLTRDINHMTYNASFQIRRIDGAGVSFTTAVATVSTVSVPAGLFHLTGSSSKFPVSSNFKILLLKPMIDMGPISKSIKRRYSRKAAKPYG
ncbi:hypothetical protein TNCV_3722461 [Trichonephila clavipes]|nr:hypothetical protein TNCV_3722461 [Trichonephila clavipes]